MTDWRKKTLDTYNKTAKELADYFVGIGARTEDIKRAFGYIKNTDQPNVLEIGCGDGRDAVEIATRTSNYIDTDPSEKMLDIARRKLPTAKFEVSGAVEYDFPEELDIIFAFASLLHLDKDEVKVVFDKAAKVLRPSGVFYISLKFKPEYTEEVKIDEFGERMFYFYTPELIKKLAGKQFETVYYDTQQVGST